MRGNIVLLTVLIVLGVLAYFSEWLMWFFGGLAVLAFAWTPSPPDYGNKDFSIEWIDRETLMYRENGRSVAVWVDCEPGIFNFNNGRIIKASSLSHWETFSDEFPVAIDPDKKRDIVAKIKDYYRSQRIKCRVDPE